MKCYKRLISLLRVFDSSPNSQKLSIYWALTETNRLEQASSFNVMSEEDLRLFDQKLLQLS